MKFIAFEAATHRLSVALWCDGRVAETTDHVPNGGSEYLLPWASALLAEAGLSWRQLDGIAFGAGPGGFTGLRLACGIAQGLAFGLDRPVLPVNTLAALALAGGEGSVIACLDARMNEVYLAAYEVSGDAVQTSLSPGVAPAGEVNLPGSGHWRGVGDGFGRYGEIFESRLGSRLRDIAPDCFPLASAVARLAAPGLAAGEGIPAAEAAPVYIRDKVALTTAERLARGGSK